MTTTLNEGFVANNGIADFYLIGELASRSGVSCKTIRFYERQGLMSSARHGRFRVFQISDVDRLRYIRELRSVGIPVKRIRILLDQEAHIENRSDVLLKSALKEQESDLLRKQREIDEQLKSIRLKLDNSTGPLQDKPLDERESYITRLSA